MIGLLIILAILALAFLVWPFLTFVLVLVAFFAVWISMDKS